MEDAMDSRAYLRKAVLIGFACALSPAMAQSVYSCGHPLMTTPDELTWSDAPAVAKGAKIAVIEGPLNQGVPFLFRLKLPANTKIAPHTHPTYERVTVLSGTFYFAHGDTYDASKTRALPAGSVAIMPPSTPMFGYTKEETMIQLNGTGPWGLHYVNPADDPRKK
jgi:quercetin dioxygenase-like cupin family protein